MVFIWVDLTVEGVDLGGYVSLAVKLGWNLFTNLFRNNFDYDTDLSSSSSSNSIALISSNSSLEKFNHLFSFSLF